MSDYDTEPVPGLPALLPQGEALLWQGSPDWRNLARRAFHVRKVAAYCGVLLLWRAASGLADGEAAGSIAMSLLTLTPLAMAAVGILALMGWLYARMTIYSITSRRLVIRSGVALPVTLNIPFRTIDGAALSSHKGGTGDISVTLTAANQIAYLLLWPNARPWRLRHAEPMLRAVPDAGRVAEILSAALAADAAEQTSMDGSAQTESQDRPSRSFLTAAAA